MTGWIAPPPSAPCLVANVKPVAYGKATSAGTSHFTSGTKLWCLSAGWGDGYEQIPVIGLHRASKRYVLIVMAASRLVNWRARVAYHPEVLRLMREAHVWDSLETCEVMARMLSQRSPPIADVRGEAARLNHALRLLDDDERGRELGAQAATALAGWTLERRACEPLPPPEVLVLADFLEDRGTPVAMAELVKIFDRRRTHG